MEENINPGALFAFGEQNEFIRSEIAQRIGFLKKPIRINFSDPERYTDSNKTLFDAFKSLSDEERQEVLQKLNERLTSSAS